MIHGAEVEELTVLLTSTKFYLVFNKKNRLRGLSMTIHSAKLNKMTVFMASTQFGKGRWIAGWSLYDGTWGKKGNLCVRRGRRTFRGRDRAGPARRSRW